MAPAPALALPPPTHSTGQASPIVLARAQTYIGTCMFLVPNPSRACPQNPSTANAPLSFLLSLYAASCMYLCCSAVVCPTGYTGSESSPVKQVGSSDASDMLAPATATAWDVSFCACFIHAILVPPTSPRLSSSHLIVHSMSAHSLHFLSHAISSCVFMAHLSLTSPVQSQ